MSVTDARARVRSKPNEQVVAQDPQKMQTIKNPKALRRSMDSQPQPLRVFLPGSYVQYSDEEGRHQVSNPRMQRSGRIRVTVPCSSTAHNICHLQKNSSIAHTAHTHGHTQKGEDDEKPPEPLPSWKPREPPAKAGLVLAGEVVMLRLLGVSLRLVRPGVALRRLSPLLP